MKRWRWAAAPSVRAFIASRVLGAPACPPTLGHIVLRDHQRDAASRLRHAMTRFGGALLADEVGLGKTFTALAAARDATALLVVAPATLVAMWRSALERASMRAVVLSFEALSRREPPPRRFDVLIIDEAHHARNPVTRRYDRLAALAWGTRVLLLSATPVHNAAADLHALLALFVGGRAVRMTQADLASCVVRRTRRDVAAGVAPRRVAPIWLELATPDHALDAVLAIPPPCPPRDGGDATALIAMSLVRGWASTHAALHAMLRRRLARAEALADALERGRHPSRAEMRAWVAGDDAMQLAFPELVATAIDGSDVDALLGSVRNHARGVRRALSIVNDLGPASDDARAALIRAVRARHPGERIVVFSQFAESVQAMFGRLRRDPHVAAITAHGASVAGGPLTREEALARFAPRALGVRAPAPSERIELLIATDLLSEGLNLQDASVVVHLDLPWTAARLEQRAGRVWRLGSAHERVCEYAVAPPRSAEALLRTLGRLAEKSGAAGTALGETFLPLLATRISEPPRTEPVGDEPPLEAVHRTSAARAAIASREPHDDAAPTASERLRRALAEWSRQADGGANLADLSTERTDASEPARAFIAAVRSTLDGWLALVAERDAFRLIAAAGAWSPTDEPQRVLELALAAGGPACAAAPARIERALSQLESWLDQENGADAAELTLVGSRAHARVAGRIASLTAAAPAHRRTIVSRLATQARAALSATRTAGGERMLRALASSAPVAEGTRASDEAWLSRVIELGDRSLPNAECSGAGAVGSRAVLAMLLLVAPRR